MLLLSVTTDQTCHTILLLSVTTDHTCSCDGAQLRSSTEVSVVDVDAVLELVDLVTALIVHHPEVDLVEPGLQSSLLGGLAPASCHTPEAEVVVGEAGEVLGGQTHGGYQQGAGQPQHGEVVLVVCEVWVDHDSVHHHLYLPALLHVPVPVTEDHRPDATAQPGYEVARKESEMGAERTDDIGNRT